MKKIIAIYFLMILSIVCLAILINSPKEVFSLVKFPQSLHILIEGTNSILMFLIFLVGNHLYSETKDERFVILAGGFLIGSIFNCVHIITIKSFPYDLLSLANIQNNPTIVYLLLSNLILPLAIYFSLMHKPLKTENFRLKIYINYFFIFLAMTILPLLVYFLLPALKYKFAIIMHSLEFVNYSLYIMLAFIVINIRQASNITFFPRFTLGLIISGLGGLFYINSSLIQGNGLLAHIFEAIGLIFMLAGIRSLHAYATFLRFKDELVAYLCLMLIFFYIVFVAIASTVLHIVFPLFSAYVFIEFILIFQFIVYLIANQLSQPITNIIESLSNYIPGEEPINIPVIRHDELGLLTEKINATSLLSWQKLSEVSKMAERERSIRRIFETMRRVSDQNIIKNTIMEEIKKAFNPDKAFIALYDSANNLFYFDKYMEHLPSKTLLDAQEENEEDEILKQFNNIFKSDLDLCFENIEEYIMKNSLEGTKKEKLFRKYKIKSCCHLPIYYASNLLGCVMLHYTTKYHELNKDDVAYLKTMATQIGIAINQGTK